MELTRLSAYLIDDAAQITERPLLIGVDEHHEGVSLTRGVLLRLEEVGDQLRRVRNQMFEIAINRENGQNRVSPNVRVAMVQTRLNRRHQRLIKRSGKMRSVGRKIRERGKGVRGGREGILGG